jgi:hypothetical protein
MNTMDAAFYYREIDAINQKWHAIQKDFAAAAIWNLGR